MKRNNNTSNTLLVVIIAAVFLTISVAVALVSVNSEKNHNKETVDKTAENENAPIPKDGINGNEGLLVQPKPEPEPETEPEPQIDTVSFVAVGDNIIHDAVLADAKRNSPDYDFRPMFENVEDIISSADFAYINQESPFAGEERGYSGYPSFNSPDKVGFDLAEIGFDIVNLANNHMMDKGVSGYRRTVEFWKSQPDVTYIGGYESKADFDNIRIIEKNGIKVALLSYTYGINSPFDGSYMYVPFADDREIDRQTREAKTLADAVIVSVHWGKEHWNDNLEPSQVQNRQMQIMVDNDVDVIIGTHPHTLEKMLWQENAD